MGMTRMKARNTVIATVTGAAVTATLVMLASGQAVADTDPFPGVGAASRIWSLPSISGNDVTNAPSQESNPISCPAGSRIAMEQWSARPGYWEMYCQKSWEPAPSPTPSATGSRTASPSPSASNTTASDTSNAQGGTTSSGNRPTSSTRPAAIPLTPVVITDQGELDGVAETVDAELSVTINGNKWLITVVTNSPDTGFNITARKPGAKTLIWRLNSGATGATSFRTSRQLSGYMLTVKYQGVTLDIASA